MESKQLADTAIPAPPSSDPEDDASYRDEKDMLRMGKLPELKRKFQSFSALGFTTAVMGTWVSKDFLCLLERVPRAPDHISPALLKFVSVYILITRYRRFCICKTRRLS